MRLRELCIHSILAFLLLTQTSVRATENPEEIRFAWLSDTHVGAPGAAEDLRQVVGDINSLDDLDFAVISGDITEVDMGDNLALAKRILDSLEIPYHIIPGNHDTRWTSSGGTRFVDLWGDDKFIFRQGDFYFIGLHQGPLMRMGDGYFSRQDLLWLADVLDTLTAPNAQVCYITHYPMDETVSNSLDFLGIIRGHHPRLILHGHGHANRYSLSGGIPMIMGRSTLRRDFAVGGYNIVQIFPDSVLISERRPDHATYPPWYREPLALPERMHGQEAPFWDPRGPTSAYGRTGKWHFRTDYTIASGPAVADGVVVITNTGGEVWALSLDEGDYLWKYQSAGPIFSTPAISSERVFFGVTDSSIHCLDLQSGELLWKYHVEGPVVSSPAVDGNQVYIGSSDGVFRCLDARTGKLIWESPDISGYVECTPLVYKRSVFFGAWDEQLYALNSKNGEARWRWKGATPGLLFSPAACTPAGVGDRVFIVAPDRAMTAIDARTGETVWRSNRFSVRESIGFSEDTQALYVKCMWDTVASFTVDEMGPKLNWTAHLGYGFEISPVPPVEKDGTVFVSSQRGFVYALDALTGVMQWEFRVSESMVSGMIALGSDEVLVTVVDGSVCYVAPEQP